MSIRYSVCFEYDIVDILHFFLFSKISSSILSLPQFFLLAGMRKGHKCKNINVPWKPLPTKDGILIAPFP